MTLETWKPILGYEDKYVVSDLGNIRSLDRVCETVNRFGPINRTLRGKLKTLSVDPAGYYIVRLCSNGKPKTYRVNRVVATAFIGPPDYNHEACHKNNIKTDNRAENLYWGTRVENERDKTVNLRRNPKVKIPKENIAKIRALHSSGMPLKELAAMFGCTFQNIWYIATRATRNDY